MSQCHICRCDGCQCQIRRLLFSVCAALKCIPADQFPLSGFEDAMDKVRYIYDGMTPSSIENWEK